MRTHITTNHGYAGRVRGNQFDQRCVDPPTDFFRMGEVMSCVTDLDA
jgi:hypothetical protein